MHTVAHFVGSERALDFLDDFFARWNFGERQSGRGPMEPIEMFMELENPSVVEPQAFPDRITALHRRIKRTDAGLIAMHKAAVDIYNQVSVLLVKLLKHEKKD